MFRKSAFSLGASTKNTQGLLHRPAVPHLLKPLANRIWRICLVYWWISFSEVVASLNAPVYAYMFNHRNPPPPPPQSRFLARMGYALWWNQWWSPWYWDLKLTLVGQLLGNIPLADNLNLFERIRSPQGGNCKLLYVPTGSQFSLPTFSWKSTIPAS